jgi:hypothetical protein
MEQLATLKQLRASLQKLAPTAVARPGQDNALALTPIATGLAALDESLSIGGLPQGRVTEIAGPLSSGKTAFALHLLARESQAGSLVAFLDGSQHFYPPAAAALGVDLQRLLLVRPTEQQLPQIARATEVIAHSRGFSMIALDWPHKATLSIALAKRIRNAAQSTGTTILFLSGKAGSLPGAGTRIHSEKHQRNIRLRILKGGCGQADFALAHHRFDGARQEPLAPILRRRLPGVEK